MEGNRIGKFKGFWCNKVLPLVYDDSLSYYEVLCKLTHKVNEIIENINNNFADIVGQFIKEHFNDLMLEAIYVEEEECIYFKKKGEIEHLGDTHKYDPTTETMIIEEGVEK